MAAESNEPSRDVTPIENLQELLRQTTHTVETLIREDVDMKRQWDEARKELDEIGDLLRCAMSLRHGSMMLGRTRLQQVRWLMDRVQQLAKLIPGDLPPPPGYRPIEVIPMEVRVEPKPKPEPAPKEHFAGERYTCAHCMVRFESSLPNGSAYRAANEHQVTCAAAKAVREVDAVSAKYTEAAPRPGKAIESTIELATGIDFDDWLYTRTRLKKLSGQSHPRNAVDVVERDLAAQKERGDAFEKQAKRPIQLPRHAFGPDIEAQIHTVLRTSLEGQGFKVAP